MGWGTCEVLFVNYFVKGYKGVLRGARPRTVQIRYIGGYSFVPIDNLLAVASSQYVFWYLEIGEP